MIERPRRIPSRPRPRRSTLLVAVLAAFAAGLGLTACGPDGETNSISRKGRSSSSGGATSSSGTAKGETGGDPAESPTGNGGAPSTSTPGTPGSPASSTCTLPAGPFGTREGSVLDPSLSWQGVAPGGATATIKLADFYDCDGSKGIGALLLDVSAAWCGACQSEAADVEQKLAGSWGQQGVKVLTLIIQDTGGSPATVQTAKSWQSSLALSHVTVAADPQMTFEGNSLPTNILVDPRTLTIVGYGGDPSDGSVDDLARKNAK
jgi:hypothetical protein